MHEELPHFMQGYQLAVRIIDDVDHASTGAHGKVKFSYRLFCLGPCLDALQKLKFFHSLSITSIFGPMHEVVNVGKKITNYTV
jgi:hypothetical protein